jgi:hypothetical protein
MLNSNLFLLPESDLIAQLSPSLGEAKANELILSITTRLGFASTRGFTQEQALSILENISTQPGLVGIVARCAKARVILKFNKK